MTSPSLAKRISVLGKMRLAMLVAVTASVGYVMGTTTETFHWMGLFWATVGTLLAALGANAFNQCIEHARDAKMVRTRNRPIPAGTMSLRQGILISALLALSGDLLLLWKVNLLTALLGLLTQVLYLALYTPMKTTTPSNTLVGAIVGAIPPMMGWTAARGTLDPPAWILFLILFLWQMPHFLSLAWLHREDYERGGFRMLPAVDPSGSLTTSLVVLYSAALVPLGIGAVMVGLAGWVFLTGAVVLGIVCLVLAIEMKRTRAQRETRRVFLASLLYLPLLLGLLVLDRGSVVDRPNQIYISAPTAELPVESALLETESIEAVLLQPTADESPNGADLAHSAVPTETADSPAPPSTRR